MNYAEIIIKWAAKHPEIVGVLLGGSRAKGTHTAKSDYDFSINLNMEPYPELVEELCKDLKLENPKPARAFPRIERHFLLVGKSYYPPGMPEATLGFLNIKGLKKALKTETNHPLVIQLFEFIKYSAILYDPKNILKNIKEKSNIGWALKKSLQDALCLALWDVDKHQKALKKDIVASNFMKTEALWHITNIIAIINKIPLGSRYDYITFKKIALTQGEDFMAPTNFFENMEYLAEKEDAKKLNQLMIQVKNIADEFLRD